MSVAVIFGAGDVGGTLAHTLAVRDRFREIRLIDRAEAIAAGKALDISQAGPVEGFRTRVVAASDEAAAADGSVVVLADAAGPPSREWHGEAGLDLVRRAWTVNQRAPIVCAGAAAAWLVARGVAELRIPPPMIVGSAAAALAAAVTALVGLEARVSPQQVELLLLGCPPDHVVIGWEEASIAGRAPASLLRPQVLARITRSVPRLWPPGVQALAAAAARVAEGFQDGARQHEICFVTLGGEAGRAGQVSALPVRFTPGSLAEISVPPLSPAERVALENALAIR